MSTSLSRERARAILIGLLLLGGIFRFQGLAWDAGHHLHPDERFISMVEEKLTVPTSLSAYFDSSRSSLNPWMDRLRANGSTRKVRCSPRIKASRLPITRTR